MLDKIKSYEVGKGYWIFLILSLIFDMQFDDSESIVFSYISLMSTAILLVLISISIVNMNRNDRQRTDS